MATDGLTWKGLFSHLSKDKVLAQRLIPCLPGFNDGDSLN